MKRIAIILLALPVFGLAQAIEANNNPVEFKANMLYTVLGLPELGFEFVAGEHSGLGFGIAAPIDSEIEVRFALTPYYRYYFGKETAQGFFMELNMQFASIRETPFNWFGPPSDEPEKTETAFGGGVAAGFKFLAGNGILGELYLGVGRYLGDVSGSYEGYPRIGIAIGRRL